MINTDRLVAGCSYTLIGLTICASVGVWYALQNKTMASAFGFSLVLGIGLLAFVYPGVKDIARSFT